MKDYNGVEARIVSERGQSRWFGIEKGIGQATNSMCWEGGGVVRMGVKIADKWCGALLYVDDIVLRADTEEELQDMLDVQDYVDKWKMKLNGKKKSKVMVVGKSGKGLKWDIYEEELEVVEAFRYLGVCADERKCPS